MTVDPWGGAGPVGMPTLQDSWREEAAARALDRAHGAVTAALRRIVTAEDVEWVGGPAARYRCELEDVADRTRAARARLEAAVRAAEDHAAAVRCRGAVALGGPSPWPSSPAGGAGGLAVDHRGLVPGPREP
jgi:hypothetical protein